LISRITAIALNTYREAVRARLLLGLFAVSLATCAYSLIVASLSLGNEGRVVADLGSGSFSMFGVVIAIVLGSTSLYRELEYKTIFPILSRPIRRWEYLVGKYAGAVLTVFVFVSVDAAAVLGMLAMETEQAGWKIGLAAAASLFALAVTWWRVSGPARVFVVIPWAFVFALIAWFVASTAPEERQLVTASAALAVCEIAIVAAVATLFASFSSPFLTATFTAMVFLVGRSADTLAHLPKKLFGRAVVQGFAGLAHVVPNLHVYVPPRPLLLGEVADRPVWSYVGWAAVHAAFYSTVLLAGGALAFRKRDFS
jgi:Cu-processing system permease protein